ncbi:hypothetical protein GAY31_31555, partial [Azospirillum brasilense]|nr:hypothetical protein [Azospirillum brasilense]
MGCRGVAPIPTFPRRAGPSPPHTPAPRRRAPPPPPPPPRPPPARLVRLFFTHPAGAHEAR